jgi:Rrf2 family nitric oxide-sensitive transcriptional repressor
MALTQTAEYALRAVVWLAQHPGQPQTTQQIAEATQVPSSYLPKVFQPLVRGGLVNGQRGLRGGYSLRRDASEITLLEVVNCVDPVQHIESCPLELAGHRGRLCPLHSLLSQILRAEEQKLAETRLGDLIGRPGQLTPLCDARARIERARTNGVPSHDHSVAHSRAEAGPTGPREEAGNEPPESAP